MKRTLISILVMTYCAYAAAAEAEKKAEPEKKTVELDSIEVVSVLARPTLLMLDTNAQAGSRLGLTVQETPASIDVITRELMRERGNTTTQQALANSSGVVASPCFGVTCVSMRGFSNTLQPLFNGIRYPGLAITPRNTFNYERIEVLKGLSSMQHGIGTVGGAINFVTKPADGREEKEVLLAYDRWDTKIVGLGSGGKLTDALAYRADISYRGANRGSFGWVENTAFDNMHFTGELALKATDTLKLTLSQEYFKDEAEGYFGTPHVNGKIFRRTRNNNYNIEDDSIDMESSWTRFNVEWTPSEKFKVRNETYYNNENRFWQNAEIYTFNAGTGRVNRGDFLRVKHDQELYGNRTELSLDHALAGMRNRLLVGFDIARNNHTRTNNAPFSSPANSVDFINPTHGRFVTNSPYTPNRTTELVQKAYFLEDYLNLTDALKLSLSARHDKISLDSENLRTPTAANPASFSNDYSGNSYRVGAVYDILPTLSVYGQWANALEPGAQLVTLTFAQRNLKLGRANQKELGLKGLLPNGLGELTAAVFDINRTDMLTRDPSNPDQTIQIGEQSSQGVEFSSVLHPADKWTVEANATLLRAQFDKFYERVAGVAVSRAGNLPPDVPEKTANLWLTYRPNADWRLMLSSNYVGERSGDNANTATNFMDSYTLFNAMLGYQLGKGELMLSVRNITDKLYAVRSYNNANQFLLGEPRTVEIAWFATF